MILSEYHNRTPVNFITLHFAIAYLFLALSAGLLFFISENLSGHYFQPRLLSIAHLAALGWITTIIFGVSYQIIPVLSNKPLYSIWVARLTLMLQTCGTALLAFSFWFFRLDIVAIAGASLLLVSFLLFTFNIFHTWDENGDEEVARNFIFLSLAWLLLTAFFGLVLLLNLRFAFLTIPHLQMLKLHCHFGFVGWFILLIMGVAAKLLPMFMLSDGYNKKLLNLSLYAINLGLLTLIALLINGSQSWLIIPGLLTAAGIVLYLCFVYQVIKYRIRKTLDEGLKKSKLAFIFLSIPLSCGLILSADTLPGMERAGTSFSVFYGFSFLFGFISLLVMAQTFKTLPFLIWSEYYQTSDNGPAILPKDLYSENLLKVQFVFFILSYLVFAVGFITGNPVIFKMAGVLFGGSVLFYGINLFKLITSHGIRKAA